MMHGGGGNPDSFLDASASKNMLDIMFEIPKDENIGEVIITKEYIDGTGGPQIIMRGQMKSIPVLD